MNQKLREKVMEALSSVLPITAILLALSVTVVPIPIGTVLLFLAGAVLLILGMGLFSLGADMAMMPMGEAMGSRLTRTRRIGLVVLVFFLMGVIVTVAEPDLAVLARQVPAIPDSVLILTVAAGVGSFLVLAMLRTLFKVKLGHLLIFFYALVFGVALFAPKSFLAVAFDSGGVTTGPITVPFIMALGIGMASTRGDSTSQEDSFGMVALSSIGPILTVLILGICYSPDSAMYTPAALPDIATTRDAAAEFAAAMPHYAREVLVSMVPICAMFLLFQLLTRRFKRTQLLRIVSGLIYTYVGLVMFLTGVNVGFMPAGQLIGAAIAGGGAPFLLIPIGMLMGYFIVGAEPAVHVLVKQVEEVSMGSISQGAMKQGLAIGVAVSIGIAMLRVLTGISILWFLIPGYAVSLALTFFVPQLFTGVAFDAGGVASGPMTATFLLPFAMGACEAAGGNLMTDAFGLVALVAMTPLVTIQLLGLWSQMRAKTGAIFPAPKPELDDIIEYEPVEV